jgi:hypothetical protein
VKDRSQSRWDRRGGGDGASVRSVIASEKKVREREDAAAIAVSFVSCSYLPSPRRLLRTSSANVFNSFFSSPRSPTPTCVPWAS